MGERYASVICQHIFYEKVFFNIEKERKFFNFFSSPFTYDDREWREIFFMRKTCRSRYFHHIQRKRRIFSSFQKSWFVIWFANMCGMSLELLLKSLQGIVEVLHDVSLQMCLSFSYIYFASLFTFSIQFYPSFFA